MMLDTRRMLLNTALRFNRVYSKELNHQAADLIDELYWELVQVKRERDAAADDIELGVCCETCKHDNDDDEGAFCVGCVRVTSRGNWEWRGVKNNAE